MTRHGSTERVSVMGNGKGTKMDWFPIIIFQMRVSKPRIRLQRACTSSTSTGNCVHFWSRVNLQKLDQITDWFNFRNEPLRVNNQGTKVRLENVLPIGPSRLFTYRSFAASLKSVSSPDSTSESVSELDWFSASDDFVFSRSSACLYFSSS